MPADAAEPSARPREQAPAVGRTRRWLRRVLLWCAPIAVAYLALFVYLWIEQERLIFKVRPLSVEQASEIAAAFPAAIARPRCSQVLVSAEYRRKPSRRIRMLATVVFPTPGAPPIHNARLGSLTNGRRTDD